MSVQLSPQAESQDLAKWNVTLDFKCYQNLNSANRLFDGFLDNRRNGDTVFSFLLFLSVAAQYKI